MNNNKHLYKQYQISKLINNNLFRKLFTEYYPVDRIESSLIVLTIMSYLI